MSKTGMNLANSIMAATMAAEWYRNLLVASNSVTTACCTQEEQESHQHATNLKNPLQFNSDTC